VIDFAWQILGPHTRQNHHFRLNYTPPNIQSGRRLARRLSQAAALRSPRWRRMMRTGTCSAQVSHLPSESRRSCSSWIPSRAIRRIASTAVQERLGPVQGTVEREAATPAKSSSSPTCARARGEAATALAGMRRAVLATGAGLLGSGRIRQQWRRRGRSPTRSADERIRDLLGDAVATPVAGLHIHIGMPDAETAIRAFNGPATSSAAPAGTRRKLALPHGRDTGLASAREVTIRGWHDLAYPRAMRDYADFSAMAALAGASGGRSRLHLVSGWKLRAPPTASGTARDSARLDTQSSVDDTAALVALPPTAVVPPSPRRSTPSRSPPAEVLEEAVFRRGPLRCARAAARCAGQGFVPSQSCWAMPWSSYARMLANWAVGTRLDGLRPCWLAAAGGPAACLIEIAGMDGLLRDLIGVGNCLAGQMSATRPGRVPGRRDPLVPGGDESPPRPSRSRTL